MQMDVRKEILADLSEEIVEEILANLPVKSLMRFKCVSKSWREVIGTKIFINKHLQNSKRRGIGAGAVNEFRSIFSDVWCLHFHELNNNDPLDRGWIIGCCNGVLCIINNGHFFLLNPATKVSIRLPVFNFVAEAVVRYGWKEVRCGFGWDEESDAYKVFVCTNNGKGVSLGKVYSSKTNAWKKVECGRVSYAGAPDHIEVGVLVSGKIHWVPERERDDNNVYVDCVEYFDLKNEVFGRIKLPPEPEGGVGRWWLRERDGCLNALYNHNDDDKGTNRLRILRRIREGKRAREREEAELFDVWVMEEYGVEESWVKKKTSIPIIKSTLEYQRYVYVESLMKPV